MVSIFRVCDFPKIRAGANLERLLKPYLSAWMSAVLFETPAFTPAIDIRLDGKRFG